MAENLTKVPKRGILKQSTSFEQRGEEKAVCAKEPHFDESNILATLHPADKDYGFMKIDEPKTPFEAYESDGDDRGEDLDANLLAARIQAEGHKGPRPRRISEPSGDAEDLSLLSPEEREKRRSFEAKRKKHYNEFHAVKMARALMNESEDEDDNKSVDELGKVSDDPDVSDADGATPEDGDGGEKSKGDLAGRGSGSNSPMDTEQIQ
jgi:protein phosphatase inhibitor 2